MSLQITSRQRGLGLFILSLDGSLNYNTFSILEEEVNSILAKSPKMIVFDMKHLELLSSAGVRTILKTQKAIKETNGEVGFMNLQPQVKKVLEIINLIPVLQIFKSFEELDEYFDSMQTMDELGNI